LHHFAGRHALAETGHGSDEGVLAHDLLEADPDRCAVRGISQDVFTHRDRCGASARPLSRSGWYVALDGRRTIKRRRHRDGAGQFADVGMLCHIGSSFELAYGLARLLRRNTKLNVSIIHPMKIQNWTSMA